MSTVSTLPQRAFSLPMRFVVVNWRRPRGDKQCALCGDTIHKGYVRDIGTHLIYCDTQCFRGATYRATNSVNKRTVAAPAQIDRNTTAI